MKHKAYIGIKAAMRMSGNLVQKKVADKIEVNNMNFFRGLKTGSTKTKAFFDAIESMDCVVKIVHPKSGEEVEL